MTSGAGSDAGAGVETGMTVGARYVFAAYDATRGRELFATDGTTAGTALLADLNPGAGDANPFGFAALRDGRVVFSARHRDGTSGDGIWVTDGTAAGTAMIGTVVAQSAGAGGRQTFAALPDGRLAFSGYDPAAGSNGLWVTDGTAAGTVPLANSAGLGLGSPFGFTALSDGRLVFAATAFPADLGGYEPWVTDGTAAGTILLKDIDTRPPDPFSGTLGSYPSGFTALADGRLLFLAGSSAQDRGLWVTDGTAAGTVPLGSIRVEGYNDSYLSVQGGSSGFAPLGDGRLVFSGFDGGRGAELWATDGTAAGTRLVKDIYLGPGSGGGVSGQPVSDRGNSRPESFAALPDGRLLFLATDAEHGRELWATDGTAAGTALVLDIRPGAASSLPSFGAFGALGGGRLLFAADDGLHGSELWITDGTAAGTALLRDIRPGTGGSFVDNFAALADGRVSFSANDGVSGAEVWVSDGTAAGTGLLRDLNSTGAGSPPGPLFAVPAAAAAALTLDVLVDDHFYLARNPDVAAAGIDPDLHYAQYGWREGREPSAAFSARFYLADNPDVAAAAINPLEHYVRYGWREGRDPNEVFSTAGYLSANPDVRAVGAEPLTHYLRFGWREGRDPSAGFDIEAYLARNPDVAAAGIDPLTHYLGFGRIEGREASAAVGTDLRGGFDAEFYRLSNPDVGAAGVDPLTHYLRFGLREGRDPNGFFDASAYLAANPDVAAAGAEPLRHYLEHGSREGRSAGPLFDAAGYLRTNPDVAAAGVNPLEHFLLFGSREGRDPSPDAMI